MKFQQNTASIETLDPYVWLDCINRLEADVLSAPQDAGTFERFLRRAFHLQALAPAFAQAIIPTDCGELAFEALLAGKHFRCAALCLISSAFDVAMIVDGNGWRIELNCSHVALTSQAHANRQEKAILLAVLGACRCVQTATISR